MDSYQRFKNGILQRRNLLEASIREIEEQHLADPAQSAGWREVLSRVGVALEDQLLRIAVVGSVKSGKSTLINTLVERDVLKRGAGITTAFVTRIRTNRECGGWVDLKPWGQIHDEVNRSLRMLPLPAEESENCPDVDLRRREDRERLRERVERVRREWRQAHGPLNPHFLVIGNLLEGYASIRDMIGQEAVRRFFDEQSLGDHQRFVGAEASAAYVRDIELHVPVSWLGEGIEIADCQGSDSPNPFHLARVQRHLLGAHFILYVINSRVGLRESDFKLLELIGTLRMTPSTFFVLNVDLDGHEDAADIRRLEHRVREELSWVVAHPRLHVFSALFHLLDLQGDAVAEFERPRMDLWRQDSGLATLTREGFAEFRRELVHRVREQRARVLCAGGLSRLCMVAASLVDAATLQMQFLDGDVKHLQESMGGLRSRQKDLQDTLQTLTNAINGLRDSLARDLDQAADDFFDPGDGPLVREILEVVEHFPVEGRYERDLSDPRRLVRALHGFYGSFRQAVSQHLIEAANGRIIDLAREREDYLANRFHSASRALWSLYARALDEYRGEAADFGIPLSAPTEPNESEWRAPRDLTPPTFGVLPEQEAVSRSILLMKFGLGRLSHFLTDLKGRMGASHAGDSRMARGRERFEDAVALVKSETCAELVHSFRNYHGAFKRDYLRRLLELGIRDLLEAFQCRAAMFQVDFGRLLEQSRQESENRLHKLAALSRIRESTRKLLVELEELSCAVHLEWLPAEAQASPEESGPSIPAGAR
ncbi:MAG: dynamin family protein [Syntrophobacteraceae bacterium]|jgi:hypothetical protein|nr:dynamin family protein [Syntrophobacteraceae bacterium]